MRTPLLLKACLFTVCLCLTASAAADVSVHGVDSNLANNIKAHLKLAGQECSLADWRIEQYRRELTRQVNTALQAFGYYHASFEQNFSRTEKCWHLSLTISPGKRTHLRDVKLSLKGVPEKLVNELHTLVSRPDLRTGDPLVHKQYDNYKARLIETAQAHGYWQARLEKSELAIYPKQHVADAIFEFFIGPRYRFGELHFSKIPLDEDLLYRLSGNVTGKAYSAEEVQDIYGRLQGSDYFRQVLVSPQVDTESDRLDVPLDIKLSMEGKHSFTTGVGYSTDQGARVSGQYRNRYYNSRGHHWRGIGLWSQKLREILGAYVIPKQNAAEEWYELSAGYTEEENLSYQSNTLSTAARSVNALTNNWTLNFGINVRDETYLIGSEVDDRKTLVVPGAGISWLDAEETRRQRKGLRFEAGVTASHATWASDVNYLQAYTRVKGIVSPYTAGRFILRVEAASTEMQDFSELPPSVRFFTGGDNSIRGYEYNSIGETNQEGEVIGGSKLTVGSIEYDHKILNNWSISTFYDVGDAFDNTFKAKQSWGLGLRWYSPVGPLRVDIAFPQDSDETFRFHLSVGADL